MMKKRTPFFRHSPQVDRAFLRAKFPLPPEPPYIKVRTEADKKHNGELAEQWLRDVEEVKRKEREYLANCLRLDVRLDDSDARRTANLKRGRNAAKSRRRMTVAREREHLKAA